MSDFRLQVFYTVAKRLSFTKAAAELFVTQPAVTKHIHELEEQFQTKLFDRNANKITITKAGQILLNHVEEIFEIYRNIEFDMNALASRNQGLLKLGASTTISQYIISPLLAGFKKKFPDVRLDMVNANTEQIERALLKNEIELGLIEGQTKNKAIKYTEFLKDEIVLVCNAKLPFVKKETITLDELLKIPLVMREQGSGTLEVIGHALKPHQLKLSNLNIEINLGSTEGIKSYLLNAPCMAFLSIHAITKELRNNELKQIFIENLHIERSFYFIHTQGKANTLAEIFIKYANHHHNLK